MRGVQLWVVLAAVTVAVSRLQQQGVVTQSNGPVVQLVGKHSAVVSIPANQGAMQGRAHRVRKPQKKAATAAKHRNGDVVDIQSSPVTSLVANSWIARSISVKGNAILVTAACALAIPKDGVTGVLVARRSTAVMNQLVSA